MPGRSALARAPHNRPHPSVPHQLVATLVACVGLLFAGESRADSIAEPVSAKEQAEDPAALRREIQSLRAELRRVRGELAAAHAELAAIRAGAPATRPTTAEAGEATTPGTPGTTAAADAPRVERPGPTAEWSADADPPHAVVPREVLRLRLGDLRRVREESGGWRVFSPWEKVDLEEGGPGRHWVSFARVEGEGEDRPLRLRVHTYASGKIYDRLEHLEVRLDDRTLRLPIVGYDHQVKYQGIRRTRRRSDDETLAASLTAREAAAIGQASKVEVRAGRSMWRLSRSQRLGALAIASLREVESVPLAED